MFLFDWLMQRIIPIIFVQLRPFIKWFLHTFTRLCELQRIVYGAQAGASRTRQVERSLMLSQNCEIQQLVKELDTTVECCGEEELRLIPQRTINVVQNAKHIKAKIHPDFASLFGTCVLQIWSYRHLLHQVERLRAELYDANNLDHEQKLLELWNRLMPEEPLDGRITKQWQDIGFQGDDPKTDFRGMGILGLENLLYFSREYRDAAHHVLLHSKHPVYGYTFAIVGINLTAMAYRLLKSGDAKVHFYNAAQSLNQALSLAHFHKFYCYLLFEFDRFWMESGPTNIMDFREIYQRFEILILEALHNDKTLFKTNLVVEYV
ncbi:ELMO domain-containing protein 2 [Eurosta solidaginis]|uniref:ELMO domain-containing protein 2 n=1 Tax=Eurosta solidaginis TaxID=178769 RepID=UPI003531065D